MVKFHMNTEHIKVECEIDTTTSLTIAQTLLTLAQVAILIANL